MNNTDASPEQSQTYTNFQKEKSLLFLTVMVLLGVIFFLFNQNRNLRLSLVELQNQFSQLESTLSENKIENQKNNEVKNIDNKHTIDWKTTEGKYNFSKSVEFSFKYPDSLVMKPSPRGFHNTFNFYQDEAAYQLNKDCVMRVDPEEDWEGACDLKGLLFTIHIGESDQMNIPFGVSPIVVKNSQLVSFDTHREMLGGAFSAGMFDARTTSNSYGEAFIDGTEVIMRWPTQESITTTEELTQLSSYDLFEKILATISVDVSAEK